MAVKIKGAAEIAAKYVRVTPGRATEYAEAIRATSPDEWETPVKAAEGTYQQAVTAAAAEGRFGKGVSGKGGKWKAKAEKLGPARYPAGVQAAGPDYQAGFEPYASTIAGLTLPPKGPRGDPANIERVRAIMDALHRKRVGG